MAGRSTASHAIEATIGRSVRLQRAPRPQNAGWVASLAVSEKKPSDDEQAAADAICAVEDVAHCERLVPPGHVKTPDWRVWMADGRVADVEVTGCTDGAMAAFFAEMHENDGSLKIRRDERLSCQWTVSLFDRDPGTKQEAPPHRDVGGRRGVHTGCC